MRLGAVYMPEQINAFYRLHLPMMALRERGHEVVEVLQERGVPLPIAQLADCDLVHAHRLLLTEDADDCVARLQEAGAAVGFDDDDDSEAIPPELEALAVDDSLALARVDFARVLARAAEADLVTTPSDAIAERFEDAGADNVRVIDSYLPGAFNRVQPQGHEGFVIGWHATFEHHFDVEALGLDAALARILETHPSVRVVTIGVDLCLSHDRYTREDFLPIGELTRRLADFDLGIVPLADTALNCARSNVKAREYAAAGVPWLASPVGAYRGLGKDEGGRLVEDDAWFDALDELIRANRERAKLAKRAKAWAKRETIWRMADVWERTFLDTIADVRALA